MTALITKALCILSVQSETDAVFMWKGILFVNLLAEWSDQGDSYQKMQISFRSCKAAVLKETKRKPRLHQSRSAHLQRVQTPDLLAWVIFITLQLMVNLLCNSVAFYSWMEITNRLWNNTLLRILRQKHRVFSHLSLTGDQNLFHFQLLTLDKPVPFLACRGAAPRSTDGNDTKTQNLFGLDPSANFLENLK